MKQRWFKQVDVFGSEPYLGNPLAVVLEAEGLSDSQLQRFARWTNLAETTFLLPPTDSRADYRVRIFTPVRELPFAGHPTLGSCHAWLEAGNNRRYPDVVVQECGVGLITLHANAGMAAFAAPDLIRSGAVEPDVLNQALRALNLAPEDVLASNWVDNGPGWLGLLLRDAAAVLALKPDQAELGNLRLGVIGAQAEGADTDYEVRAFLPGPGAGEDPVTGSLNAGLAQWLIGASLAPERYVVSQGTAVQRSGRVRIFTREGRIWVGGATVTCLDGTVNL